MPSANQRLPAELAENARCAANIRRGIRHSSTVGINLQNEWRRSARLALADLDPHRSRLARIRNRSPDALELQV